MSRGIGKLQQKILQHLETAGRWQTAQQVIAAVADSSQLQPTRSLEVSVRRAAQGLQRRGLIELGSVPLHPHQQTAYWLADQAPPHCLNNRRVWHSWLVCELIIQTLSEMTEQEAWESFQYDSRPWVRQTVPEPGEVTYRHLVARFLRKFPRDCCEGFAARKAILRAVRRLEREGKLTLFSYDEDPGTIGTVRPVRQASPGTNETGADEPDDTGGGGQAPAADRGAGPG